MLIVKQILPGIEVIVDPTPNKNPSFYYLMLFILNLNGCFTFKHHKIKMPVN